MGIALKKAQLTKRLAEYYEKTRELARRMTEWDMNRKGKSATIFLQVVFGMMEAANRGASEVTGGRSVGRHFVAI